MILAFVDSVGCGSAVVGAGTMLGEDESVSVMVVTTPDLVVCVMTVVMTLGGGGGGGGGVGLGGCGDVVTGGGLVVGTAVVGTTANDVLR